MKTANISDEELETIWILFYRLSYSTDQDPVLKEENYQFFHILLKRYIQADTGKRKTCKAKLNFMKLLEYFENETTEKGGLNVSQYIVCLDSIMIRNDKSGWIDVKCFRHKAMSIFTKLWCCLRGDSLHMYNTTVSVYKPYLTICLSSISRMKLSCDNESIRVSICITLESGQTFQLRVPENDTRSWYKYLETFQRSKGPRAKHVLSHLNKSKPDLLESDLRSPNVKNKQNDQDSAVPGKKLDSDRWNCFISMKRHGNQGKALMTSRTRILADISPGDYKLKELMPVRDLPPLRPKHVVVKNVQWNKKQVGQSYGTITFSPSFNEHLPVEHATSEFLSYYGCRFVDMSSDTISLSLRHGVQDFDYKEGYLEEFVLSNIGAGIEKHDFTHLDCPLQENSGLFILGELYGEDEIHLTAFKIPPFHTLYVPGGCIHSNDYLQGVWRTMLSDESDIDHVLLVKKNGKNQTRFHFKFN